MFAFIQYAFILFIFIISQVSTENQFKQSIKCYQLHEQEDTVIRTLNITVGHAFQKATFTIHATEDNIPCSKVGCVCFSYRGVCSHSSRGSNHFGECTDADKHNRIIQWHRGWSSQATCEQMRQQSETYLNLTCCSTDYCNNQPGKVIKFIDIQTPIQIHNSYDPQNLPYSSIPQKPSQQYNDADDQVEQPMFIPPKPSQWNNDNVHHSFTSRLPNMNKPSHSSIKQTEKNITKSIKINKPSAIIPANDKHTASLIFLHGLGDVGESWLEVFDMYNIPKYVRHVKFIFPTAPIRKITLNYGMSMTGWFDAYGLDRSSKEDQKGILEASKYLNDLIEDEINHGIPSEHHWWGGAAALHTALTTSHMLAGVLALSAWLPLSSTFPKALIAGDKKLYLPILQCHGKQDPVVQMEWGRLSEKVIKEMGFKKYVFKEYDGMVHSSCDEEIKDVIAFIKQYLPKIEAKI
ncbi:unnamed protein product [Rotaria sp. Silwood1]|nr:unnamed protein product [Rotaria sp. Silwood1]